MNRQRLIIFFSYTLICLFLLLTLFSHKVYASIDHIGVLDNVLVRYQTAASTWSSVISARASWLFWTLAIISMVWTFGMMALRKADIGEFFAEFIRFTVTTGFFWWLLSNGPGFATSIMNGMRQMAAIASGNPMTLTPSGIVDIGFAIFFKVINQSSVWSPIDSVFGIFVAGIILVLLALVAVNMLILLICGWILAYAGIIFLGFGGSKWTSEMAIGYFKTVLGLAIQLMTMILLVGIGKSFVDQYYNAMSAGLSYKELGVMLIVAVVLLDLVTKVPPMIGAISGCSLQALGGGFGAGSALAAGAAGAAAIATAGAALAAGTTSMAGGAKALMAAFSSANASESGGGGGSGIGDLMAAAGGGGGSGGDSGGDSPLASAMGDPGGGSSSSGSDSGGSTSEESSGSSGSKGDGGESGGVTSNNSTSGEAGNPQGGASDAKGMGDSGAATAGKSESAHTAGGLAAKVGRVSAGTVSNLAAGTWEVTKDKGKSMKENFMGRVDKTTGGKIATAINVRSDAKFDGNSLSAGKEKAADAESEVAAFRDRH
jgi:type IV secretion system protein TrbL